MANHGPGPIPNRWLHCPRKSDTIIAERFLAFKTPLCNLFNNQLPIQCIFTPEMIFGYCKTLKLKLGLWIDLTNTKRFYDRDIVESRGTQYVKLQCRGHGETPSPEQTQSFIEIVETFINDRPFDIIAVHCTHGFNRTGFLIVSYMVERLDCSVEAALSIFAKARPPGIYKQDYINELYRRYDDDSDPPLAPELPDWSMEDDDRGEGGNETHKKRKYEVCGTTAAAMTSQQAQKLQRAENGICEASSEADGDDDDGDQEEGGAAGAVNGGNKKPKRRRRELIIKDATFMEGVPGVELVTDPSLLSELQRKVQDMCGWEKSGFPGAQPVSMDRNNLKRLHDIPYMVSWKADGTRYMMLIIDRNEIYFVDRNLSCFLVENLSFVQHDNLTEHLKDTLLDGEMVLDKFKGETIPRYLVYDIVKIDGKDIGKETFRNRLKCIKHQIIEPRYEAITKGIINRPLEPFSVRNKDFWDIRQSASLLGEKFAKSLLHQPDGLIFQPSTAPYTAGVCPDVLKWKPMNMNSVDFRLKISMESGVGILNAKIGLLYVGGHDMPFSKIKYTRTLKDLDNRIIECAINSQGQWEFLRERVDKTMPNSYSTASSVIESIRNPVTTENLLDFIASYGYRSDNEIMPPPSTHNQHRATPHHHQQQQQPHQHPNSNAPPPPPILNRQTLPNVK